MKRMVNVAGAALSLLALLSIGCSQLPRELRSRIDAADTRLLQAEKDFQRTSAEVLDDLKRTPDLFGGTRVATEWPTALRTAKRKLDDAERDRVELQKLPGGKESIPRAERLLAEEERLRQAAIDDANEVQAQANRWLDFKRNLPHYLAKMGEEHNSAHSLDLTALKLKVEQAEHDWPAKKDDLDRRVESLEDAPSRADQAWKDSAPARDAAATGTATGPQIASLIEADNALDTAAHLGDQAEHVSALAGQIYNAWDKILEDLDVEHGQYREKVKLVKTHFVDVAEKKTELSTDVQWDDVSPAAYRAVENDLGMAIAHKDAGLYDSEAVNTAQPPGFAYMAPPSVGSNQYGYWTHNSQGSFWTFLPQYLIMRELFWGPSYRPIYVNEYNGYYAAQRLGRSYYGESTPAAPPKYGTHGTFTQQHYASSRYVQSGGFRNSGYASHQTAAPPASPQPHYGSPPPGNETQGKRFGHSADAPPAGRRFGSPGGGSRPSGKSFGRRR